MRIKRVHVPNADRIAGGTWYGGGTNSNGMGNGGFYKFKYMNDDTYNRVKSGAPDSTFDTSGNGSKQAAPNLLSRAQQVAKASGNAEHAFNNALDTATSRAAEMGQDYEVDSNLLMKGAAGKASAMTNAGFNTDVANTGIQNQFALDNAQRADRYGLAQQQMSLQKQLADDANSLAQKRIDYSYSDLADRNSRYYQDRKDKISAAKEASRYAGLTFDPYTGKVVDTKSIFDNYLGNKKSTGGWGLPSLHNEGGTHKTKTRAWGLPSMSYSGGSKEKVNENDYNPDWYR